jgi:hypothetical protein
VKVSSFSLSISLKSRRNAVTDLAFRTGPELDQWYGYLPACVRFIPDLASPGEIPRPYMKPTQGGYSYSDNVWSHDGFSKS